ncbi:MAG: hypothetical protein IIV99_03170, partial [Oscillospiraceae bacterium]|nr:hypothetical protein [Oscillospiraceae bacterium]
VNDPDFPTVVSYTLNASIDDRECKPYRTVFGHWANIASTVFDYSIDTDMCFTNANNLEYLTSDSAYALYFDMGTVKKGKSSIVASNYGVYSNETVSQQATMAINVNAPDVIQYATDANGREDQTRYENDGHFTAKTYIDNFSSQSYSEIRVIVYTAGCIDSLDQSGVPVNSTYENPYYMDIIDVEAGEDIEIDWNFIATPQESGQYSRINYKIYDISKEATQNTGAIMEQNLLGQGSSYILCPGSVSKIPQIKFTGSTPDTIYSEGVRTLYITGENFSMIIDQSAYKMMLSRADGLRINGQNSVEIPSSQIYIDDAANVMTVIFSDDTPGKLAPGQYQLTLDYTDSAKTDISGQALRFYVSEEIKYKNDAYGFLAVMIDDNNQYSIRHFTSEDDYWLEVEQGRISRQNVVLEIQGSVIKQKTEDNSVKYTGTSLSNTDNVMTVNGVFDVRDGTLTVTEKNGSVTVDFDAEIYTTGAGTHVWTGVAALTELEAGTKYGLIPYSEDGDRLDFDGETITLLWPSVGQGLQSIAGLLFELKYGELGVIAHENAPTVQASETRVVGFGAAMDLSFLIPEALDTGLVAGSASRTKSILGSSWDAAEHNSINFSADEIRALNKRASYRSDTVNTNANAAADDTNASGDRFADGTVDDTSGYNAAAIVIDDILYGDGQCLGVNMAVTLGIPPYINGLPALEGTLEIRTVGDWYFSVEGQCHFIAFSMEAGISFKSKNDIPIPDSMRFFVGNITPGINIDGVGVLWLQGGGGGIENLYDTFFLVDKIPPLKLIISAQFSLMQLFSATASLGLSLRGIDVNISNGQFSERVDETTGVITRPQPITMDAGIMIDWYPEFYFQGVVNLMLAKIIEGSGYIIADQSGFFEFFLRAGIQIPADIPIFGGIQITEACLGASTEKIWGQNEVLGMVVGLVYYWGGEVEWGSGTKVYPTYPELVGMEVDSSLVTFALDYDEETQQTLYMSLGTNVKPVASSDVTMQLYNDGGINDTITSNPNTPELHLMKLTDNGSGKLLVIQWQSENEKSARKEAEKTAITDVADSSNKFPIKINDNTKPADAPENKDANANFTFNSETGTASLAVNVTSEDIFKTSWNITTDDDASLVIYDVAPLPQIEIAETQAQGSNVTLRLDGTQLESFTKLTFFAEGKNTGNSYFLGGAENPFAEGEHTVVLTMPEHMATDEYTITVSASNAEKQFYSEAGTTVEFKNPLQPKPAQKATAQNAGDYKVAVKVTDGKGETDGYHFTAYDKNGNVVSGMSDILMYNDGNVVTYNDNGTIAAAPTNKTAEEFIIGGRYEYTSEDETTGEDVTIVTGFSPEDYTIEVRRWKRTTNGGYVLSEPVQTSISVREPVKTQLTATVTGTDGKSVAVEVMGKDGTAYEMPCITTTDAVVTITSAAEKFTGNWRLDGVNMEGTTGEVTKETKSVQIALKNLKEGTHSLQFTGKNQHGDAVAVTHRFTVDTLGPRVLLAKPVTGSLFDYLTGELTVAGVSDKNAVISVVDNTTGQTVVQDFTVTETNGSFSFTAAVDNTIFSHELSITATDAAGNKSTENVTVTSNGLGSIEKIAIFSGNEDVTNKKLASYGTYPLTLKAKLKTPENARSTGLYITINEAGMIDWNTTVAEGEAEIELTADGAALVTKAGAKGMVTARFLVNDEGAYTVCTSFNVDEDAKPVIYRIVKGDGQTWKAKKAKDIKFTVSGPQSKFAGVEIDGENIYPVHFEVDGDSGKTVVVISAEYLAQLKAGEHTIRFIYDDGVAEGVFYVDRPEGSKPDDSKPDDSQPDDGKPDDSKPDDSKPDDSKPDGGDDSQPDDSKPDDGKPDGGDDSQPDDNDGEPDGETDVDGDGNPDTGDISGTFMWFVMMLISLAAVVFVIFFKRKNKNGQQ